MLGAFLFFLGGYITLVIGAILAQVASVIDGCDGEIARLKIQVTEFGGWFDAVLDRYADAFLLFGLTYYVCFTNCDFFLLSSSFFHVNLPYFFLRNGIEETKRRCLWGYGKLPKNMQEVVVKFNYKDKELESLVMAWIAGR